MRPKTSLLLFPPELLLHIWSIISSPSDHLHLLLACRRLATLFHTILYTDNIRNWTSSSLFWACRTGRLETIQHALEAGASPNTLFFADQRLARINPKNKALELFWPGAKKPQFKLWLPPAHRHDMMTIPLAATPLSLAAQHRHPDIARFLLDNGADAAGAEHRDTGPARDHHRVWKPLHWALCCGHFRNPDASSTSTATPTPASAEIVAALLRAGADPNAHTLVDPVRGMQYHTRSAEPAVPLAMAACCAHSPGEVLRLLLAAGADAAVGFPAAGCRGRMGGSGSVFYWLEPHKAPVNSDDAWRDEKLVLLLKSPRKTEWIGGYNLAVGGEVVRTMLASVTLARLEVAETFWGMPSYVTVSGVYALLDVWVREWEALAHVEDGGIGLARETLKGLERLIARLYGFREVAYLNKYVSRRAARVDLRVAFLELCSNAENGNTREFVKVLESQGIIRDGAARQLSVSDTIQQKFEMFRGGKGGENPYTSGYY
ncbi:hypothetical protein F4859DRAFT_516164 [Xylaria cf. heliscus]|nr:hypothetical protein F4859DRAFT_516164 [Xylaria cf. heliscus]